jgi:aldose 1-epimerase
MKLSVSDWGKMPDGQALKKYTLSNGKIEFTVTNLGGIITSIKTPDKNGKMGEVCLGYNTPEEYLADTAYFGAMIGRYANRIAGGKFTLNGAMHQLSINEGDAQLHGGGVWNKSVWDVTAVDGSGITLEYLSPDGECGYPGNLKVKVRMTLRESSVVMDFFAASDKDTYVSITNHAYFNLTGKAVNVLRHEAKINASRYTPVISEDNQIPTGEIAPVKGTKFDFTSPRPIEHADIDHNFVLDSGSPAAVITEETTGKTLEVHTNLPCIQFYVGAKMAEKNTGLCLEPQFFPNGPNQEGFQNGLLRAGEEYRREIVFLFKN